MSIIASLCDSRTCNQSGGGEHIKPDIEDLLSLHAACTPSSTGKVQHKVDYTTCLGMCNRSPNIVLKSSHSNVFTFRVEHKKKKQALINDGGLRMRVDSGSDDTSSSSDSDETAIEVKESSQTTTNTTSTTRCSSKVILNELTIPKLARVLGGLDTICPLLVAASDCRVRGKQLLRTDTDSDYEKAWEYFQEGLNHCQQQQRGNTAHDFLQSTRQLQASLYYWSSFGRLQQYTSLSKDVEGSTPFGSDRRLFPLLQSAANGVFRVLQLELEDSRYCEGSNNNNNNDRENNGGLDKVIHDLIYRLVRSDAGTKTESFRYCSSSDQVIQSRDCVTTNGIILCTTDIKVLVQCMVVLGDAWKNFTHHPNSGDANLSMGDQKVWEDGAQMSYQAALKILAMPAAKKLRILRAMERRRIQTALDSLLTPPIHACSGLIRYCTQSNTP